MKISFYARFTKNGFISHFMPIPLKREINGHFRPLLRMTDPSKAMKRSHTKIEALVSREIDLVSLHFTSRFMRSTRLASKFLLLRLCGQGRWSWAK
jgi:hypothetical protein